MIYALSLAICLWIGLVVLGVAMMAHVALSIGGSDYDPSTNLRVVAFTGATLTVAGAAAVVAIWALLASS
jgi:hypothetical protein